MQNILAPFENGTLPKAQWTHAAHLSVGACYLLTRPPGEALDAMRAGVRHYNNCVGTDNTEDSGYHETLTCFWMQVIGEFLAALPDGLTPIESVGAVVSEFGERRDLFREYYSFDVVKSREARRVWITPDRARAAAI